jgi:coproporphyrinogen III oxidase-like Fe-S oxidoreductase
MQLMVLLSCWLLSIYLSSSFERHMSARWNSNQHQKRHQHQLSASTLLTDAEVTHALSYIRTSNGRQPDGVYIHVPFCRRRCFYCSFPIKVVGDRPSTVEEESRSYTELLIKEMRATASQASYSGGEGVSTVYFGGGTPSLLPNDCIAGNASINHSLRKHR